MGQDFLYRGVNSQLHESGTGLQSKSTDSFSCGARYGEATYGTGWTYGDSQANAVLRHQLNQAGFPTSGISTTPTYERAIFYATGGKQRSDGYVYTIDRRVLARHGVREFVVSDFTTAPGVPQDEEVILVVGSGGALPDSVVTEIVKVPPSTA